MKIWICYVFAVVAFHLGETVKAYIKSDGQTDDNTIPSSLTSVDHAHYLPNQSSLASTLQPAPKSITPVDTQDFGYEKKPLELDAILPNEYIRTVFKSYPIYVNEKHSQADSAEAASDKWAPNEMFAYQNRIESDSTAPMHPMNHITRLSPFGPAPQVYPMISCTQLSAGKHLKSQSPSSTSYAPQPHAAYSPLASYCVPSVAPFEHVQTILKPYPYHSSMPAVKYIEPQMNSIVPMQSISPVTTYNPMSSAAAYAHMPSGAPFEHWRSNPIQTMYPIYIKEEQQPMSYVVEQSPPPPPPHMSSNFWHPETFAYKKPTFAYHNNPDSYDPFLYSEPMHTFHSADNFFKHSPVFFKEKQPPRTISAFGPSFWSATSADGSSHKDHRSPYFEHKKFLMKRKLFSQQ